MRGFGWNFYGFFLFAIVWIVGYFFWAAQTAKRERLRPARGAGGKPGPSTPPSGERGSNAGPPGASERGWGPASPKKSERAPDAQ
jgi:hypothetical protein